MSDCALYCVSTPIRRIPEFTQLESVKSMFLKCPANAMAGLHCQRVSAPSRVPLPPARINASVSREKSGPDSFFVVIGRARAQESFPVAQGTCAPDS